MIIQSLELENFRNYGTLSIHFDSRTNILYGDNAQGKTNILEAVYLSAFNSPSKSAAFLIFCPLMAMPFDLFFLKCISTQRSAFISQLNEIIYEIHLKLSGGKEALQIVYEPD